MKQNFRKTFVRLISVVLTITLIYALCGNCFAISASSSSFISEYLCDFEGNYTSVANSKLCTDSTIKTVNGKGVLEQLIKDNSEKARFVIQNTNSGDFVLKDGNTYAVTVKYKVVQVAGKQENREATIINLARLDGNSGEMVKIKTLTGSTYYPGDSTDWVTSTAVFKLSMNGSENYNKLAVNVVSTTCPSKDTGASADRTVVRFDEISIAECNSTTNGIEFISNGGEFCEPLMAQSGEAITLPTPNRDLYEFKGWYTDIALTKKFTSSTMPSSLTTKLYAKWAPVEDAVIITFDTNGAGTVDMLVGRAGDPVTLPRVEKNGYLFSGWYTKDMKTSMNVNVFPEKSVMVYAKWDVIPMVYDFEDFVLGALSGSDTRYCNGEAIIEKDASLEGNQYLYFKNVGRNSLRFNSPNSGMCFLKSGEYTVTFKYKFATSTKKLQLGVNRFLTDAIGTPAYKNVGADISNEIYVHDSSLKADKNGWYTGKFEFSIDDISDGKNTLAIRNGATGRDDVSSPVYIDDVIIRRKGVTYKNILGYDSQGGTFCETEYVKIGDVVTLPKPTKEGYRFIGWSYDKEGFQQIEGETITVESAYTLLYADWYKIPEPGDTPESEATPEQEPTGDQNQQSENKKGNFFSENKMLIIIGASALVLIVVVAILIVVIVKKKKKKQEVKEETEE